MFTKQEIEREILTLNTEYNKRKEELNHKLFELLQLDKEMQSHIMKKGIDFYIDVFKHLLQLEKIYCNKSNPGHL